MTAEELWEKKEVVGIIAVILFFAAGLLLVITLKSEVKAWGTLEGIHRRSNSTHYDILVRKEPKGPRLFRERIINPKGRLKPLKEKKPGDEFLVKLEKTDTGWRISGIPEPE